MFSVVSHSALYCLILQSYSNFLYCVLWGICLRRQLFWFKLESIRFHKICLTREQIVHGKFNHWHGFCFYFSYLCKGRKSSSLKTSRRIWRLSADHSNASDSHAWRNSSVFSFLSVIRLSIWKEKIDIKLLDIAEKKHAAEAWYEVMQKIIYAKQKKNKKIVVQK